MGQRRAWVAAAALLLLQACDHEVRTVVIPPRQAASDAVASAPVAPPAEPVPPAAGAQPQPAEPQSPPTVVPQRAPEPVAPPGAERLPEVRNPGDPEGARLLARRALMVPVAGIPPAALMDTYEQGRGSRVHEAIDIAAPSGTPVVAVDDGTIAKLFTSKPGGLTVYQFDPEGRLSYYYAHLESYAGNLREGMTVKRGDVIGYVGSTGNADRKVPHLHFAIFKLGADRKWWQGDPINPYPALRAGQPAPELTAAR